eukprot:GHVQ01009438.1.p1 GENE.GHVQ01009438.1~~GHVQ01009438.1.p1  ORF type:complete len:462 (+),score=126.22 GHVQ01009438.1:787-2172(+)
MYAYQPKRSSCERPISASSALLAPSILMAPLATSLVCSRQHFSKTKSCLPPYPITVSSSIPAQTNSAMRGAPPPLPGSVHAPPPRLVNRSVPLHPYRGGSSARPPVVPQQQQGQQRTVPAVQGALHHAQGGNTNNHNNNKNMNVLEGGKIKQVGGGGGTGCEGNATLKEVLGMLKELVTLDQGLSQLFRSPPENDLLTANNYEALVVYRGRLARRVSRYSQVVKALHTKLQQYQEEVRQMNWLEISNSSGLCKKRGDEHHHHHVDVMMMGGGGVGGGVGVHVRREREDMEREIIESYQIHSQSLQRHKSRLSRWWSGTERHFHTLRMASFVSEVELSRQNSVLSTEDSDTNLPVLGEQSTAVKALAVVGKTGGGLVEVSEDTSIYQQSNSSTVPGSRTSSIDSKKAVNEKEGGGKRLQNSHICHGSNNTGNPTTHENICNANNTSTEQRITISNKRECGKC